MKIKNKILSSVVVLAILLLVASLGAQTKPLKEDLYLKQLAIFTEALAYIRAFYVRELTIQELIYSALKGMLNSLGPHCEFMSPDEYEEIKLETKGEFVGVGLEITSRDNQVIVISPLADSPAERAGLVSGDIIVKIKDKPTEKMSLPEIVAKLRGEAGTKIELTIQRGEGGEIKSFLLEREKIKMQTIKRKEILDTNIGYIRLVSFGEHTKEDLEQALKELEKKGALYLILDLRNNSGGSLEAACEVVDEFLEKDKLIVYTKGRKDSESLSFKASGKGSWQKLPLVVLVNRGSASASEIVAGAIKDSRRGKIIGTKTFGKGSVQTLFPLKDGSALKLTTAFYFTPSNSCINEVGIVPDLEIPILREAANKGQAPRPDLVLEEAKRMVKEI